MVLATLIGKKIEEARKQKGYTQKQVAEKLAVTPQNLSKWERAISIPDVITLLEIGKILNKNIEYFLHEESEEMPVINADEEKKINNKQDSSESIYSNSRWFKLNLKNTKRDKKNLNSAVFRNCNMEKSFSLNVIIESCEFGYCLLQDASFSGQINKVTFKFCNFSGMVVKGNINETYFHGCQMKGGLIDGVVLQNSKAEMYFDGVVIKNLIVKDCKLKHISLHSCSLDQATYNMLNDLGVNLSSCKVIE